MAKRDMIKTAAGAKVPTAYDMKTEEMFILMDMAENGEDEKIKAFMIAFRFGFEQGKKAAKKEGGRV